MKMITMHLILSIWPDNETITNQKNIERISTIKRAQYYAIIGNFFYLDNVLIAKIRAIWPNLLPFWRD